MARGLRELLCYHTKDAKSSQEQLQQCRALLSAIKEQLGQSNEYYEHHLSVSAERLLERRDSYVFHEYLESENHPLYFGDFIKLLEQYGLQYVGDTELDEMDRIRTDGPLDKLMRASSENWTELQQRKDMVDGTMFRRSVICRDGWPQRPIAPHRIASLLIASSARFEVTNDAGESKFVAHNGATLATKSEKAEALGLLIDYS